MVDLKYSRLSGAVAGIRAAYRAVNSRMKFDAAAAKIAQMRALAASQAMCLRGPPPPDWHSDSWCGSMSRRMHRDIPVQSRTTKKVGAVMTMTEKLNAARAASAGRLPAATAAIMKRATEDLRTSGILQKVVSVGQRVPEFAATSHDGRQVSSRDLLARGPLVVSFFRGAW